MEMGKNHQKKHMADGKLKAEENFGKVNPIQIANLSINYPLPSIPFLGPFWPIKNSQLSAKRRMRGCPMAAANSLGPIFVLFLSNQYRCLGAALSPSLNYSFFFFFCLPTFDGAYILPTAFFAPFDFVHRYSISHWAHSWPLYYHHFVPPPSTHSSAYFKGYCEGATNQPKESSSSISIHSLTVNELAHLRVDSHLAHGGAIIPHSPFYHIGPIIPPHILLSSGHSTCLLLPPFGGCHPFFGPKHYSSRAPSPSTPHFPRFFADHLNGRPNAIN